MLYAVLSVFFFQAIQALRPRMSLFPKASEAQGVRLGLRFVPDILHVSTDEYYRRWTVAEIGPIDREIAQHVHVQARVNGLKFVAIDRRYKGLLALAALTAGLATVVAYAGLRP